MNASVAAVDPMPGQADATSKSGAPASVIILTLNEAVNIEACLASCRWCDDVHVVDSGSTDRTVELAEAMGATLHHHPFTSFGEQRNWAIDNVGTKHDWIFHLDADERFTPELVDEMARLLAEDPGVDGFLAPQRMMMMGTWIKRSAGYPIYQVRFFHKHRMRFIDHGHGQREDPSATTGVLKEPYVHEAFSKGIDDWISKHNRYSTLEAEQVLKGTGDQWRWADLVAGDRVRRRRAVKQMLYHVPGRPLIRFAIVLLQGGIFEGRAGLTYAHLIAMYERMIAIKVGLMRADRAAESRRHASNDHPGSRTDQANDALPSASGSD
ncbi:MAG: glycosyltransferase family 2 protein [Planctomycetota bacterium]